MRKKINLQSGNDQKMGLQEPAVHLRPLTSSHCSKDKKNRETKKLLGTPPLPRESQHVSQSFSLLLRNLCVFSLFFCEISFFASLLLSAFSPPCAVGQCYLTVGQQQGLEGNYICLGLEKAGFPWEVQVSAIYFFTHN